MKAKRQISKALKAMKDIGIPVHMAKPVLKKLLQVYEHNWEYIEAENYRVLADAILDFQESKDDDPINKKSNLVEKQNDIVVGSSRTVATSSNELEPYRKRLRMQQGEQGPSILMHNSETDACKRQKMVNVSPKMDCRGKRTELSSSEPSPAERMEVVSPLHPMSMRSERAGQASCQEISQVLLSLTLPPKSPGQGNEEPSSLLTHRKGHLCFDGSSKSNDSASQTRASETLGTRVADRRKGKETVPEAAGENIGLSDHLNVQEKFSANVEIASSSMGEVKLSFTCDTATLDSRDFHMPSTETVCKMMEYKCFKSYKILDPNFSLMNIMKEICQCFLELGSESTEDKEENIIHIVPTLKSLKKSGIQHMLGGLPACSSNVSQDMPVSQLQGLKGPNGRCPIVKIHEYNENARAKKQTAECSSIHSQSLVVVQHLQNALGDLRPVHYVNDVTKGEERVGISIVNEVNSEQYPPSFHYIPHNIVYQNAYINISLARIGDENCCSDCLGDCLAAAISCACARETGGEFAYTRDGLLRKDFLDACISMYHSPEKHHHFYCKDCPLERSKNEVSPDPCKGHLLRKFIKECWSKCGCNKQCGNRVVQRGITCNLQVFFTGQVKGWGLRTLDELPGGTFVCEYVGEILTNMELYDRTIQTTGKARHTYPVLLDADWATEGVLKDEEALCLDATFYGNVGRFINHRCFDANLIGIPVEVESPDHHYYHLAFFTTRKIEVFEELTWDYGIDFDDHVHPIKAFKCCCGSKFCRDMKSVAIASRRSTKASYKVGAGSVEQPS